MGEGRLEPRLRSPDAAVFHGFLLAPAGNVGNVEAHVAIGCVLIQKLPRKICIRNLLLLEGGL